MFGLVRPIPGTFLVEFDWYFELFETGLLPRFFVLRLLIDWFGFWVLDWLFWFHDDPVPVDTSLARYFELPWNILSICSNPLGYCF